ncbi:hypothetical protein TrLO_g1850 [Triparma laevis f. longispina]|uniref:Uncharacterized protein n=1 Tax=Triparma laevis f. longispina TaxID=1714387 RepID=A0A9W7AAH9_9STRA|nr:hypothetical protein TrLO_g1850 [Triparma laevis f. longispina]
MVQGASKGVYIINELTENTCEWTRAQQVDLKITVLPANILVFLAKKELAWANQLQEKFRRNGKEVDLEVVAALTGKIIEWRGKSLMEDQVPVFRSGEGDLDEGALGGVRCTARRRTPCLSALVRSSRAL